VVKAVILLSGGIDSSTTLAFAKREGYECYALSFDYGQRHRIELEASQKIAQLLGVKRHLIIRFDMREIGGSALTGDFEVPTVTFATNKERLQSQIEIPVTYVPARNTIFLSFALAWAEVLEAPYIFIGANAIDYSGYPDCRPEYLWAFEDMANLATKASVEGRLRFEIKAPLLYMTKAEIIRLGTSLGLDYSLTWSCYNPQEKAGKLLPCGRCDSCYFRIKGFKQAGMEDPLHYA
jgi:7-cyano-7-deazaguanine synthase